MDDELLPTEANPYVTWGTKILVGGLGIFVLVSIVVGFLYGTKDSFTQGFVFIGLGLLGAVGGSFAFLNWIRTNHFEMLDNYTMIKVVIFTQAVSLVVLAIGVVMIANAPNRPAMYGAFGAATNVTGEGLSIKVNHETFGVSSGLCSSLRAREKYEANALYTVSVSTQPSSSFCTLQTASSGRFVNDLNVLLMCHEAYTLGGSTSNLPLDALGLRLSLTVNGIPSGSLEIAQNGQWMFLDKVQTGMNYLVRIDNQPTPARCDVLNGSGLMGNSPISNVQVNCSPQ